MGKEALYMNKETGEILTFNEMIKQGNEEYDLGDDTSVISWDEIYTEI